MKQFDALLAQRTRHKFDLASADTHDVRGRYRQLAEAGLRGVGDRGPKMNFLDTRPMECRHAHRARLARCSHNAIFEQDVVCHSTRFAQRRHLRMCRDVGGIPDNVVANGHYFSVS